MKNENKLKIVESKDQKKLKKQGYKKKGYQVKIYHHNGLSDMIPDSYWGEVIEDLKPIRAWIEEVKKESKKIEIYEVWGHSKKIEKQKLLVEELKNLDDSPPDTEEEKRIKNFKSTKIKLSFSGDTLSIELEGKAIYISLMKTGSVGVVTDYKTHFDSENDIKGYKMDYIETIKNAWRDQGIAGTINQWLFRRDDLVKEEQERAKRKVENETKK